MDRIIPLGRLTEKFELRFYNPPAYQKKFSLLFLSRTTPSALIIMKRHPTNYTILSHKGVQILGLKIGSIDTYTMYMSESSYLPPQLPQPKTPPRHLLPTFPIYP